MARPAGDINAGSMADIAFLLLIFFLVTTTMDVETGIQRRLPPMPDENQQAEVEQINKRNIMVVLINSSDRLFAGGQEMHISMLKDKVKEFLTNPANLPDLPEKREKDIEGFGAVMVSRAVVSLQNDRGTSYNAYIQVQNELVKAFNEVRDEFAMRHFGKKYNSLEEDQQRIVRDAVPMSLSEREPREVKSRRR
ncbi:MAG: biopolymer transporter ExbD [Bacteroidales bacterium]|jgi:biopolymer transport protein ExbD|nr:biopolymer transporter ExbD [Bacteroidales bacterium]MDD2264380.1 biopolymer transporter ExbD [Bacteroidales bacterium]MDD2831614.1 biopolymer transporter ExbD [Bacteroidales bacterium]MDD3209179.1 biopolymer transporter ExbD [Bacteroidales bacterium]MDD3697536.1 biopolymer transporter ExbD [Bacteroidales bacterium]